MQDYELKDPGFEASGRTLRKAAAHTISQYAQDTNPDPKLGEFFADCAEKTGGGAPALPDGSAIVVNATNVTVKSSAGTNVTGNHPAVVTGNTLTNIKLAATVAPVTSGLVAGVEVTGTGTKLTLTVSGGKITAAVLSA
jgi:hypothetical protein